MSAGQKVGLVNGAGSGIGAASARALAPCSPRSRSASATSTCSSTTPAAIAPPQGFERRSWADAYRDHGLIFCRPDGTPHHPDTISGEFERLVKFAAVERIRFHDMRHTHATLLLESGVDITVVSKRLGHASVKTTADLYVHVTERLQEAAAERFSAYGIPLDD